MRKELRPKNDDVSCDICGRTILKGERTEAYLAPGGNRHVVCQLCNDRALHAGWIRESAHTDLPAASRGSEPRRSIFSRFRRRRGVEAPVPEAEADAPPPTDQEPLGPEPLPDVPVEADYDYYEPPTPTEPPPPAPRPRLRRKDPRHVRAVPTNGQAKVERALDVFNKSDHVRTIAGIGRTLGEPWVSAQPVVEAPSEVSVVVAWELSWYHYRVDLADTGEAVSLVGKGQELDEIDDAMRDWNATAMPDGRLAVGVPS